MHAVSTTSAKRIDGLDALRGFALLGVCAANLFVFSGFYFLTDSEREALPTAALDGVVAKLELIFIENKFMGLFSFLFGASFWFFLDRTRSRGLQGERLFYRRLFWLFAIGAVHGWLLWCFDILRFYSLWGLLLPVCLKLSQRMTILFAIACGVILPALFAALGTFWPHEPNASGDLEALVNHAFSVGDYGEVVRANWIYDWHLTLSWSQMSYQIVILGRMLFGLCAARALMFDHPERYLTLFRRLFAACGIVGVLGNVALVQGYLDHFDGDPVGMFATRVTTEVSYVSLTFAYACAIALISQSTGGSAVIRVLAPVGRTALTCYLMQTVIALFLFYGFMPGPHFFNKVGASLLILASIAIWGFQTWAANLWLKRFRFGPVEWLWRSLTYWKVQPLSILLASTVTGDGRSARGHSRKRECPRQRH